MNFLYCERTNLEAFGEPLNAISNIAFILCGIILIFRKGMILNPLPYSVIFIGISSFLFHYLPNKIFSTLDIFSILLFVIMYNVMLTRNILNYSVNYTILSSVTLLIISFFTGVFLFKTIIGTSGFYIGLLLYMIYIFYYVKNFQNVKYFLCAIAIFFVSIIFRSIDPYLCNSIFFGTHFIWHILNSVVIYLLSIFLLLTNRTTPEKPT